jgi:hypothetical protein
MNNGMDGMEAELLQELIAITQRRVERIGRRLEASRHRTREAVAGKLGRPPRQTAPQELAYAALSQWLDYKAQALADPTANRMTG